MNEKIIPAIIGLIGVIIGGVLTWLLNKPHNKRNLYISSITKFRSEWTKEIKVFISDFIAYLECYKDLKEKENARLEIKKKMELIELNLNPLHDEFDEEYVEKMHELYQNVIENNQQLSESDLKEFKELSQKLVKIEWAGIKAEALKGTLSKQEKIKLRKQWLQ